MEPVSCAEWASPLKVGVHAHSFYSALPEKPTRDVLQVLRDDPRLVDFLERYPLGQLELSGKLPQPDWNGMYDRLTADVTINSHRAGSTFGHPFVAGGLKTVSEAGSTLLDAMSRTLYHEIGHHVLEFVESTTPGTISEIGKLLRSGRAVPISRRAGVRSIEYFAETFSAYRFEDTLVYKDPEGYDMVEVILNRTYRR